MKGNNHFSNWLYLPLELKVRDLNARVLLASIGAEKGFRVVIGHKSELQGQMGNLPSGNFFMYGFMDNFISIYDRCLASGHNVVAQDEEGLVVWRHGMYQKYRISSEALKRTEIVFAWGDNQKKLILDKFPWFSDKISVTGCPRFDLLREPYRQLIDFEAGDIKKKYGPFILINTNFGSANHFNGKDYYYTWLKNVQYIKSEDDVVFFKKYISFQEKIYAHFIETLPALSAAFPGKKIIIRPHPSENRDTWRRHVHGLHNVDVVHEGNVLPWILAADMLIHNGCTTGVEAYMLNTPVIAYRPFKDEQVETYLPNALSLEATSLEDLLAKAKFCDNGMIPAHHPEQNEVAKSYIEALDGPLASERILDSLANQEMFTSDGKDARVEYVRSLARNNYSKHDMPNDASLGRSAPPVGYMQHKFPGLPLAEVRSLHQRLQQISGRFDDVVVKRIGATCYCFEQKTVRAKKSKRENPFISIQCPVCEGTDFSIVFETTPDEFLNEYRKKYYNLDVLGVQLNTKLYIKQCSKCSFVFVNPRFKKELYSIVYNEAKIDQHKVASHAHNEGDLKDLWNLHYKWNSMIDFMNSISYFKDRFKTGKNVGQRKIRLLDFGCGMGHLLDICKTFSIDAVGVDVDKFRLDYCRQKNHDVYLPDDLPPEEKFDVVISENVIEHVDDLDKYLSYINFRLNIGGIFSFNGLTPKIIDIERKNNSFKLVMPFEHINFFTSSTLDRLTEKYGFKRITSSIDPMQQISHKGFHENGHFKVDMVKVAELNTQGTLNQADRRQSARTHDVHASNEKIDMVFSDDQHQVFFGYYDVTPFSADESKLLALHAPLENSTPLPTSRVSVGYYELDNEEKKFHAVGDSTTWCWQMGCRLQWFPKKSNDTILYNKLIDGQYGCVVQDIHTKKIKKEFKRPLYTVSQDGRWGLSLNFSRLQRLRPGYGYSTILDNTAGNSAPNNDGMWRIDMLSGEERLLFSLKDISKIAPSKSMDGTEHYFNHVIFNPTANRFMFFHLWVNESGIRKSRLLTSDINGKNIKVINDGENTSHYCWKSDREILATSTHKKMGLKYFLYDHLTSKRQIFGNGMLNEDGHPSFLNSTGFLVTDTYPDRMNYRSVIMYDQKTNKQITIGKYFSPPDFTGEVRCDLHPRLSQNERYVCVDAVLTNKRSLHLIDISKQIASMLTFQKKEVTQITSNRSGNSEYRAVKDITVVIRSVGERTEEFCRHLIAQQVPIENIVVINKAPFSEAVREAFKIGIDRKLPWTACVDADVLLKHDALDLLLSMTVNQDDHLFEVQGQILDKFFGGPRDGGPHLYRTSLLRRAIEYIPAEGEDLRPESHTILKMKDCGFPYIQKPLIVGFHDYGQYYRDIFRKCYVQAHKHSQFASAFLKYWRAMEKDDMDFRVALWGFAAGIAKTDDIRIDINQTPFNFYEYFSNGKLNEKNRFDFSELNFDRIEEKMIIDVRNHVYEPIFKTNYFLEIEKKGRISNTNIPDNCSDYSEIKELVKKLNKNEAVDKINEYLNLHPDDAVAHNDLALLYTDLNDYIKASHHYHLAAHYAPGNEMFVRNYELFVSNVTDEIAKALKKLDDRPSDAGILRELGQFSLSVGLTGEAKMFYKKAMEIENKHLQ